ncbi:MAG: adenylate/guanylate cyclase domain-containing protein [Leptospirales bacterium]|nr:adenylate/guanylate cyclase domain-containing protein [Leptospirales bacterium]
MRITFEQDLSVQSELADRTLLEHSLEAGIAHAHACGGQARCSTCRVIVLEGLENLAPRNEAEAKLAARKGFEQNIRLACQSRVHGSVRVRRLVMDEEDLQQARSEEAPSTGREQKLAILFSDIRNFTSFSERNLAYDVVHMLNRYFRRMGAAVLANQGVIDKYIGDGLMALFGLEGGDEREICRQAVNSAVSMVESLGELNVYLRKHFDVAFNIGVGIHYGEAIVGALGHQAKREFTAIGDAVNTASRIESLTKKAGAQILISESVMEKVRDVIQPRRVFSAPLRGKSGRFRLYELTLPE